ncbi:MAG: asparagine--tRNA ligase [Candidatus Aenigmatarchaeota archaeon]|nr:asparagine--tRNA ligase [Candidatus Aenigmarchaeota archaeon]
MEEFIKISDILDGKYDEKNVWVRGWVYRHRSSKENIFFILRDSSERIQCVVKKNKDFFNIADKMGIETSLYVYGFVRKDNRAPGGREIEVEKLQIIGQSQNFPISKDISEEFLLDVRHLWVRSWKMINVLKIRSTIFNAIHEFFKKEGYYYVQAPFFVKTSESGLEMFEVDYFGKEKLRLSQTAQFYLEALIYGLEKVYTLGPSFRAEKSKTARHLTEYWHCEAEAAWMDLDGLAKLCENLVSYLAQSVLENNKKELKELGRDYKILENIVPPFPRITYTEALEILKRDGIEVKFGKDLRSIEEKQITAHFNKPVIVTHYPKKVMAFYKPRDQKNPELARCLDILAPEVGFEIIGGSERDLNIDEMKKALIEQKDDPRNYEWYFDLRRYGSVPHAGFGLGVDRVVMWFTGVPTIKDAIAFPRTIERTEP